MTFYKLFFHSFCVIFWSTLVLSKPIWNQELIKSRGYVPKTNTFDFTLKRATLAPDGFTRSLATFNGQYPGPTIEVNKGDSIAMKVLNELGEPTAIHSHGIFQRGTPWFDGVPGQSQCLIPNNFTFTYEFAVPDQAGTYWYHSHAMTQYVDGAVGALIIHDPDDPYLKEYDEEIIVMLTDYYHTEAETLLKDYLSPSSKGVVPVPDNGLINGKSNFDCSKAPQGSKCVDNADLAKFEFVSNKRYRLRIINTSAFSSFFFSIDKHEMEVIEVEGSYTKRNKIHRLPINVAQRYSVIVTANQPVDNYIMRSEFQKTCMPDGAKDLPIIKAIVHYDGAPEVPAPKDAPWSDVLDECVDLNQGTLQPLNEETPPQSTKELDVEIELDVNPTTGIVEASIDGSSYVPDIPSPSLSRIFAGDLNFPKERNAYIFDKPGEVVDISFINGDIGEHPFHMHGHQFWVLGFGKGIVDKSKLNTVNPIKRDTSAVPASGWSVIRFIPDNPGAFGLHCHMEWHLQAGLLMQLIEFPEKVKAMSPPQAWVDLCKMNTKY